MRSAHFVGIELSDQLALIPIERTAELDVKS